MNKEQKLLKINKMDQYKKPVEDVVFKVYNTREDAEKKDGLSISSASSNDKGEVVFDVSSFGKKFYIKEVSAPSGYKINETEIIPICKDNGIKQLIDDDSVEIVSVKERPIDGFLYQDPRNTAWSGYFYIPKDFTPQKLGTRIIGINRQEKYVIQRIIVNPEGSYIDNSIIKIIPHDKMLLNSGYTNDNLFLAEDYQIFDFQAPFIESEIEGTKCKNIEDITKNVKTKRYMSNSYKEKSYLDIHLPSINNPIAIDIKIPYKEENDAVGLEVFWNEGKNTTNLSEMIWKVDYYSKVKEIITK